MVYSTPWRLAAGFLLPLLAAQAPADQPAPHATGTVHPTAGPRPPLRRPGASAAPTPRGAADPSHSGEAVSEVWAARYAGNATDMTVDAAGNVLVTGTSSGASFATVKYSASGQPLWAARHETAALTNWSAHVAVDAMGNVYVSGTGINPGPGSNREDFITLKYSASGTLLWTNRFDGGGGLRRRDFVAGVVVDAAGNVYVSGTSDQGGTVGSGYGEFATVKYSPTGQRLWTSFIPTNSGNLNQAVASALDGAGDVVVTGLSGSSGYLTCKYAGATGQPLWQARYESPGIATKVAIDGAGNVVVTGTSSVYATLKDCVTLKYSASGQQLWVVRHNGPTQSAALAVDSVGNVYVASTSYSASISNWGLSTVKYATADGQPLWLARHARTSSVAGVVVRPDGQVSVVGGGAFQYAQTGGLPAGQPVVGPVRAPVDPGACHALLDFAALAPAEPAITLTYALPSGPITSPHVFPVGVSTVTASARSSAGTFQQTFLVTVNDSDPPTLTVPTTTVEFTTTADSCAVTRRLLPPPATDLCGQVTLVGVRLLDSLALSAPYPVGFHDILWRATDEAGNVAQVYQRVHVRDETAPMVRAQPVTVRLVDGQATVTAAQVNDGSRDACGLTSLTLSRTEFTAADLGANPVTLTGRDRWGNVDSAQAVVTVLPDVSTPGPARYRLHAGGGPVTTSLGTFAADQYAAGGSVFATTAPIAGTQEEALYQTERYGTFTYTLPVPNGRYIVKLHFAEIYWRSAGQRVFDVAAEGTTVLSAFDILKKVGPLTATLESFPVTVADGQLTLAFAPGAVGVDLPKVSAIEVLDAVPTAVLRLNAGADTLSTSLGRFAADQYVAGGTPFATTAAIAGTEDDALYQTERYGTFRYSLPVPNGTYTVKLHFAELYWNAPGQRVFDVAAEGIPELQAYDIVQKVGPLTATTESFSVTVSDGVLSLAFTPGVTGVAQPKVSAIEVLSGGSTVPIPAVQTAVSPLAAPAAVKLPVYSTQVKPYPNPSADGRYTVELPAAFQGQVTYTLLSSLGTTLSQGQRMVSGAGQPLTFDFSPQLAAEGVYHLHLRGAKGQAHIKLLRK